METSPQPTPQEDTAPPIIDIRNVSKSYGDKLAVDGMNLTIDAGDVFGFIGPNGAGKTTTIRMLATLLKPSRGTITIDGLNVVEEPTKVRAIIGYMPDFFGVYDDVKVWEYLDFFGAAYRIPKSDRAQMIDDVLELTDLTTKKDAFVEALSRGMKQRLCLAKTLLHDPKVLLLDEPASGLDPRARIEIRELLKELHRMGKTIFVSSHILTELADICNKVGIIENGTLLLSGDVDQIMAQVHGTTLLRIEMQSPVDEAVNALKSCPGVTIMDHENSEIRIGFSGPEETIPDVLASLVRDGVRVTHFGKVEADLEDLFIRVTQGIVS